MTAATPETPAMHLLAPPYRRLRSAEDPADPLAGAGDLRGTALLWHLGPRLDGHAFEAVRSRPGGVPLVVFLPGSDELERPDDVLRVVELCRPQSVLPYHPFPDARDVRRLLSRPPDDLAGEVTDYLEWRGIELDLDTRRLVRRIVELSAELRSVTALSRSLYLSRRALGRRFLNRGLPVPSHWLQMARLLRAATRLQSTDDSIFVVGASLGYPDGFSLSNQMKRLLGVRPGEARSRLGWEWLFEAWLMREAGGGGLKSRWARLFTTQSARPRSATTLRVAEAKSRHDPSRESGPARGSRAKRRRDGAGVRS